MCKEYREYIKEKKKAKNQFGIISSLSGYAQILPCLFNSIFSLTGGTVCQFIQICVSAHVLATFYVSLVEMGLEAGRRSGTKFAYGDVLSV